MREAFNVPPDARLILDPQLCLRPDVDRSILITRPQPLAERDYVFRLLHPTEAVLLSLFEGHRTVHDVSTLWAELTGKSTDVACHDVSELVRFYTTGELSTDDVLIDADESGLSSFPSYDPMSFIVPSEKVNLTERRLRIPYVAYFIPTLFCPHNCIYCYAKTSGQPENDSIAIEKLREVFSEMHQLGIESVQLSGGEILISKNIFKILKMMAEEGLATFIPTKLRMSYETAARLRDVGIDQIQFSLDSVDSVIVDRMVGVSSYHELLFATLDNMRRAGLTVRINTVLTPINVGAVGPFLDYIGEFFNITRVSLSPYGRSLFRHQDALFVDEDMLKRVEDEVAKRQERYPHMIITVGANGSPEPSSEEEKWQMWRGRAYCTANRDGFVILPDGRVTVCEELYDHPAFLIGDLTRQAVMEMWRSPEAMSLLNSDQSSVEDGPCKTCGEFTECQTIRGRCWRDVLKSYGWDRPHWPDPRCPHAPPGNRLG